VPSEVQSLSTKRAQVEFHNFASLGEPERVVAAYAEENVRRGAILNHYLDFTGSPLGPFLEIGANAGHSSYMLVNEYQAPGFALDISADALRHGRALMDYWKLEKAPIRVAGDATNLPFADNSLRMVMAFQMLSQFQDIEAIFLEVKRVLAPGGIFYFAEEPIRRMLSLRLYRCGYYSTMKPWERKLFDWGLLGFLVQDVVGADQEESFGIRQNHRMRLHDWDALVRKHFSSHRYHLFVSQRGWGERVVGRVGRMIDKHGSEWVPARLLGGTLAALCKKDGNPPKASNPVPFEQRFEQFLRCPDCCGPLRRIAGEALRCGSCGYGAALEDGVYNLLRSKDREELYPGLRPDIIDFSQSPHDDRVAGAIYEVEGVFGNKYRWLYGNVIVRLERVTPGGQVLRIRGFAHEKSLAAGKPVRIAVKVNGQPLPEWTLDRPGLFVLEAPVPYAPKYNVEIAASPVWSNPPDERVFTVNLSSIRLVPPE